MMSTAQNVMDASAIDEAPLAANPIHHDSNRQRSSRTTKIAFVTRCEKIHHSIPYLRRVPLAAVLIIGLLVLVNLLAWTVCGLILTEHSHLLGTAAIAYSLGLRHALDADHISAIDLMTRRLIASGQRPVTVGTFFSLGHSTVVMITSIVVAATAAGVSKRFDGFSRVGGIIGTSISSAFLLLLGIMNAYILYKLLLQLRKVIHLQPEQELEEGFKVEGGGVLFRVLRRMFKIIDRPWKMYPLGFLFGLGFDTSSEVALLGISSIQGAKGTSIWLILIFPILFTVGMCLLDTIDGALMMGLYVAPMGAEGTGDDKKALLENHARPRRDEEAPDASLRSETSNTAQIEPHDAPRTQNLRVKSPLTFLYYSSVLTFLTVVVALIIGTIQLLSLILNVAVSEDEAKNSLFWRGVGAAGDNYDIIGAAICGSFIIFGALSVLCYRKFRTWVDKVRAGERLRLGRGPVELIVSEEEGRDEVAGGGNANPDEMAGSSRSSRAESAATSSRRSPISNAQKSNMAAVTEVIER